MTAPIDAAFVAAVRAALAEQVGSIVAEAGGEGWRGLQHRQLAERVKALVAAWQGATDTVTPFAAASLLGHAAGLAARLRELQGPSGLFAGGDNVDSPPDSAFSINDLADALLLLRHGSVSAPGDAGARRLAELLEEVLAKATPALVRGGVHTPNHRWELSAALARLHRLRPRPELAARVAEWLAEGIDIDGDGLYSERSANYAAYVSNPSLLTIAEVVDRPDLVDVVERNLDATLDLLLPDGSVETILSRRQDQRHRITLAGYLLPLRDVAHRRGRGDLAWAAGLALAQGIILPAEAATRIALDPAIALALPAATPPERPRQRVFGAAGLLVDHRAASTAVVFGGSDYARHRRIRSGLANSPTFLRLFAGAAVLDSVRLSRTFFGLGPFRGEGLVVDPSGTRVTLTETVAASYFQPLAAADRDGGGSYRLADEGRFSAAMDFDRRRHDDVALTTTIRMDRTDTGVRLALDVAEAVTRPAGCGEAPGSAGIGVPWALELAFRPGGTMTGARSLGGGRWQLDAATGAAAQARYRVGIESLTVTVIEAQDGQGGPLRDPGGEPAYHPGEDYEFLGGTDAATGERLYLAAQAPARLLIDIHACDTAPVGS